MSKEYNLINIFTYQLPRDLANQIYNEYQQRESEAFFLVDKSNKFSELRDYKNSIKALLALSIFHKRVISNLDSAVKFYSRVINNSDAQSILIGSYDFTYEERNKLLGVVISYNKLIQQFNVPPGLMDYHLTKDFLLKVRLLRQNLDNG